MRRRFAREIAVQSLYHLEMNAAGARQAAMAALRDFRDEDSGYSEEREAPDFEYIVQLVEGTWEHRDRIDRLLSGYLKGWTLDRLSRVDRQILRLAVYEWFYLESAPPKVIVNEAIELAKYFGTEESGRFVNGVLGKMLQEDDRIRTEHELSKR